MQSLRTPDTKNNPIDSVRDQQGMRDCARESGRTGRVVGGQGCVWWAGPGMAGFRILKVIIPLFIIL